MIDYNSVMSRKIQSVKPSGIRRFFDLANGSGIEDIISLSIGEPDFSTPWHIRRAAIESIEKGRTYYSPNRGFAELLQAISDYFDRRFHISYDPSTEILVTVGGSEAIDCAIRTLVEPGDEVLIPQPSFVCYEPLTQMAGGTPVPLVTHASDSFRLTPEILRAAITPRTKLLILPFPNNPTGGVMRREHLEAIAEVLRETNVMVLSDEIYAELTYGHTPHVSIAALDGMRERTIVINGFSKAFAMTGWRLGYALGPAEILRQMTKLHQFGIMSAPTTAQFGAIEAMKNGDIDIENMRCEYDMRRRMIVERLRTMGLDCFEPEGAFYVFPSIQSTGLSSEEFCTRLLQEEHVAVVPGSAFGTSGEGFVRISYSYSMKHLTEAMERIEHFLHKG